jgi:2-(1,2-epoxy-1,2-dihydrophenyl)acetyl-CoA isomerase
VFYQNIIFEIEGPIARLTLHRPDRLNAFCDAMFPEITRALDEVEGNASVRVLVFSGSGRGFCAGADLDFPLDSAGHAERDLGATLERNYNPLVLRLRSLQIPVIAAVNGVAAGAGVSFALAADIVVAARSASFVLAFARIGLVPDAGATYFLTRILGTARAMGLTLLGEKISAEQAHAWGLIWEVVDDEQFVASVAALAERCARGATRALALTKSAIYAAEGHLLAQQLGLERASQKALGDSADFAEGVAAFQAKRKAIFQGY